MPRVCGLPFALLIAGAPGLVAMSQPLAAQFGCALNQPAPWLPLHTSGRSIVDQLNRRDKLSSVAWYGAESVDFVPGGLQLEPLAAIVHRIRCMGFNSVRLPWSNQM
jgi:endoglucanase